MWTIRILRIVAGEGSQGRLGIQIDQLTLLALHERKFSFDPVESISPGYENAVLLLSAERTRDVFRFNLWSCHYCSLCEGKKRGIDLCGELLVSGQPPKNSLIYWAARAGPLYCSTDGFNSPTRSR
jgi:hypothetical protein